MINIIIIELMKEKQKEYQKIIEKVLMQYDYDYQWNLFDSFSSFKENRSKIDSYKIYIIGLENYESISTYIREELDDWQSMIIEVNHQKRISTNPLLIVDTINPITPSFQNRFQRAIQICIKNFDQRNSTLKFQYKKVYYRIEYQMICYIEKEKETKNCIIYTNNNQYFVTGTLNTILEKLDHRFLKCNKNIIVNLEQMESYDTKNNIIRFKNGKTVEDIARNKKKNIQNYYRGLKEMSK